MLDVMDSPLTRMVQEAERRRIARDLHDSAVQTLTALVTELEYFKTRRLPSMDAGEEVVEKLTDWQELARESLLSLRQTLGTLRNAEESKWDFVGSVQELIKDLRDADCTVTCEYDDWPELLPFEYASNLYYIVHEACTNIRKHAQATHVDLFFFSHEEQLHISVIDNGNGMCQEAASRRCGDGYQQGLIGMRERAHVLGGQLMIESIPERGTRVDVMVPLP